MGQDLVCHRPMDQLYNWISSLGLWRTSACTPSIHIARMPPMDQKKEASWPRTGRTGCARHTVVRLQKIPTPPASLAHPPTVMLDSRGIMTLFVRELE